MSNIRLYNTKQIDQISWNDSESAKLAQSYIVPLMQKGVSHYIPNLQTELFLLKIDDLILPLTLNTEEWENAYVCSPYTHYITYAKEELNKLQQPFLEKILYLILTVLGWILKLGKINKVVILNNWMVSTNLYPSLSDLQITEITHFIQKQFPNHAIIFRSLNCLTNQLLMNHLRNLNYDLILSRQVYLLNANDLSQLPQRAKSILKKDFKLLDSQAYYLHKSLENSTIDSKRLADLYQDLYLDKYSYHNPQFNQHYFKLALESGAFQVQTLVQNERIDAVLGFYILQGVMTTPLFGYDTNIPQKVGLYRMLSAQLVREANQRNLLHHQSSGAAEFKRCRGCMGTMEYNAVFVEHLPFYRRVVWKILKFLANRIAEPIFKKYKL